MRAMPRSDRPLLAVLIAAVVFVSAVAAVAVVRSGAGSWLHAEAGAVVAEPDQTGHAGQGMVGAGPPRFGRHRVTLDLDDDRRGTVRGARRTPAAALRETHCRVAVTAPERSQRAGQIERSIDGDSERGHGPSLARPAPSG